MSSHNTSQNPNSELPPATPLRVVGAAILREQAERMRADEDGARNGEDVEAVHRMRVATRRLRAALRVFVPDDLKEQFAPIQTGAREIASALGAVRDLDVLRLELSARDTSDPDVAPALAVLVAAEGRMRAERQEGLRSVLSGPPAGRFWEVFSGAVDALEHAGPEAEVGTAAPELIRRKRRKVARSLRGVPAPTSSELHRIRIRCKRLRYAAEFFRWWLPKRDRKLIALATRLQDTLGAVHDVDVAPEALLHLVRAIPPANQSGGEPLPGVDLARAVLRLVGDHQRRRDELLGEFRDAWTEFLVEAD